METEGSLTVARPKGATQCSVGHSNCLNMPKTGGREDMNLDEMALEVITDIYIVRSSPFNAVRNHFARRLEAPNLM